MRKGNTQLFFLGWNADYPDPENFLFLLNGPQSTAKTGGENASNYENPEFDRLFERMKNMPNGPERQAIIDRMVKIAREDAPWVWGFHPKDYGLAHAWVHEPSSRTRWRNNGLKYQRVDTALREAKRARVEPARCCGRSGSLLARARGERRAGGARLSAPRAGGGAARPEAMLAYIVRRLLYAIPILIGVNLITFALFFVVNTPDDMARMQLGAKRVTPEAIEKWKAERGYDKPLLWNAARAGHGARHRHHLLREVGEALRVRLRQRRRRARYRARDPHPHVAEPRARASRCSWSGSRCTSRSRSRSRSSARPTSISGAWCCASR